MDPIEAPVVLRSTLLAVMAPVVTIFASPTSLNVEPAVDAVTVTGPRVRRKALPVVLAESVDAVTEILLASVPIFPVPLMSAAVLPRMVPPVHVMFPLPLALIVTDPDVFPISAPSTMPPLALVAKAMELAASCWATVIAPCATKLNVGPAVDAFNVIGPVLDRKALPPVFT
jgi:hypothetical protein